VSSTAASPSSGWRASCAARSAEHEPGHDAEVRSGAAHAPEELGLRVRARPHDVALGRHELDLEQVVDRQAVLAHEPTDSAAEREAGHARVRDGAGGDGEAVLLRRAVELAEEDARIHANLARRGVDGDTPHRREVDHHAALRHRVAGRAVAAALDRDLEAAHPGVANGPADVVRVARPHDQCGAAVDRGVPETTRVVVAGVAAGEDFGRRCCSHRSLLRSGKL
jgi:hypothetical protein